MSGISIVICAYNAVERLRPTLAHLAAQQVPDGTPWELIFVDNNSTDGTGTLAREFWDTLSSVPMRVLHQPTPGVAASRVLGISAAQYDIVGLVDDDNWLAPDWIRTAIATMAAHPAAGACGGLNTASYEVEPPAWLPPIAMNLAVGGQGSDAGDVTDSRGLLWASGLVLRRAAWHDSRALGVDPVLRGRVGASLMAGEDSELCLMLRLAGWRLWFEPRLRLTHAIGRRRLTWTYICGLFGGDGAASPWLDGYHVALRHRGPWTLRDAVRWSWPWQAFRATQAVLTTWLRAAGAADGDPRILSYCAAQGRLTTLLRARGAYSRRVQQVVAAVHSTATRRQGTAPLGATGDVSHAR